MSGPVSALRDLMEGRDLSRAVASDLVGELMDGEIAPPLQAALLVALAVKGETRDELAGAAEAMRRRVRAIPHRRDDLIDTCGTGGDGKGTFNVSTAAALVASAAGAAVAKHGNRSVSSRSGSADVLEALGVPIELAPETVGGALDEAGIAFLYAPALHPAMREVMPVRRALGVRTVFNLLGPLTNPAGASRQLLGVYAADRVVPVAGALAALGSVRALVVHGLDGLDEISLSAPTRVAEVRHGEVSEYELTPEDFGVARAPLEAIAGGDPAENARRLESLLAGERGALRDVTIVNAAAALVVAGLAESWRDGAERAGSAIDDGAAVAKLRALRDLADG